MSTDARFHIIMMSTNKKTGMMPVVYASSDTCPVCRFKGNGCYAENFPLGLHWRRVNTGEAGGGSDSLLKAIKHLYNGTLWRYGVAGDLPHEDGTIDTLFVFDLVKANKGKKGFAYTHHDIVDNISNRVLIAAANRDGFTINLSADTVEDADRLMGLGIAPVVVVLDVPEGTEGAMETPGGKPIQICPATYKPNVTCMSCGLCQKANRKVIVGFPAHGSRKKAAAAIARS